jgi:uncharacterized protein (TIGR02118 family)
MIKLVVMYPWPADPEHFRKHYLERHLPLCRAIPGALRVHYSFEPQTVQGNSRWFCIYEAEYPDEPTLRAALDTSEAKTAAADVANYSTQLPTALIYEMSPLGESASS